MKKLHITLGSLIITIVGLIVLTLLLLHTENARYRFVPTPPPAAALQQ